LAHETSPYLLQHKDNPVDWYAWGDDAFAEARARNKPVLLSIGYSACHWCHVMAHESFENPDIAQLMNELFVNIKVDREERPDIDSLYMMSVQMMTGHGGWPMTVFLTPDGKPFYGGTYYPPEDRGPMPGLPRILQGVSDAYRTRREQVDASSAQLTAALQQHFDAELPGRTLSPRLIEEAGRNLASQFDNVNGGFGGAPKFPAPMSAELLLRVWDRDRDEQALRMAEMSLDRMARGGLYDQVGGGFHRYTVDAIWLVPHFEKMLYDNALLAHAYTEAWQATQEPFYRVIVEETLDYVLREMTSPDGGFYSTQDADTEGHEGKFYVWTPAEIVTALGEEDGRAVNELLGVSASGNFEGSNVLSIPHGGDRMRWRDERFEVLRAELARVRAQRTHPGRDDKVLTSWNGLMLRAFAAAGWSFDAPQYVAAAAANATFIKDKLWIDGGLRHSFKDGVARIDGFLEDYAFLIDGLLALYQATFDTEWIVWARELAQVAVDEFYDVETGAFYDTAKGTDLIARPRDAYDNATPSGNSVIADAFVRLAHLSGDIELQRIATGVAEDYASIAGEQPHGFSRMLAAVDFVTGPSAEVAIIGDVDADDTRALLDALRGRYLPRTVLAADATGGDAATVVELLTDRTAQDGNATAYVCVNHACQLPTTDPEEMLRLLDSVLHPNAG
jgi:hypothetical protein